MRHLPISNLDNVELTTVADVNDAVALASRWAEEGAANWFRGQAYPWRPQSSRDRWLVLNPEETLTDLDRFKHWVEGQPAIKRLAASDERSTAIAQHFGVPTPFVDFTTSPEVAGLFSRDWEGTDIPGPEACIFCLDTRHLQRWMQDMDRAEAVRLQLYPETIDMPELHRLTVQRGVFLHAPGDWYASAPMRCIVFERGAKLTASESLKLYPETGTLEEEMRALLAHLQAEAERRWLRQIPSYIEVIVPPPPKTTALECFGADCATACADWPEPADPWLAVTHRIYRDPTIAKFDERFVRDVRRSAELASKTLHLVIAKTQYSPRDIEELEQKMARAWNAMADLPYAIEQRLACVQAILDKGLARLKAASHDGDAKPVGPTPETATAAKEATQRDIALHATNGAYSEARVDLEALVGAFDPLLVPRLSETGRRLLLEDPLKLMTRVREPSLLFSFRALTRLFVEEILPMQLLSREKHQAIIFSPAQLDYLGAL